MEGISEDLKGRAYLQMWCRLVHAHVLNDFAKDERPWVEALCAIIADNADLLMKGQDASFQNKVHLGMQAKGFDPNATDDDDD